MISMDCKKSGVRYAACDIWYIDQEVLENKGISAGQMKGG